MNILPLVFALVMILMVMTIEKIDNFKNQAMIETAYQYFLSTNERQTFNIRQRRLYGDFNRHIAQLHFGYLLTRTGDPEVNKNQANDPKAEQQMRLVAIALLDVLYGQADFYKKVKNKRENLPEDLLNAIKEAVNKKDSPKIKEVEGMAWLQLDDPELQEVFYHILKGTVTREEYAQIIKDPSYKKGKAYVSLLKYIDKTGGREIYMAHAPLELLKAVFQNDQDAIAYMKKRTEVDPKDSAAADALKAEFIGKRREGLEDNTLDFSISKGGKHKLSEYN